MGWISWLCPGIQLKRWLLLFTAGVIVCAFSLALLFNNQVMGMAEELLFRLSYLATGEYGNTVPLVLGIVGMLVGIGIMIYAVRRIVRSIVEAVSPERSEEHTSELLPEKRLPLERKSGQPAPKKPPWFPLVMTAVHPGGFATNWGLSRLAICANAWWPWRTANR